MNTSQAPFVYVSYSRADISFAQHLFTDLQRSGFTVWVDQIGLVPGTSDWETAWRDAIGKAYAVILIASEEARKSPYIKDELRLAHDVYHLPIYPFWVAGTQWLNCIPLGWGGTQYIDARGGETQYQAALHQLIAVLERVPIATPRSLRIFVSHSSKDNDFGIRLVESLRRELGDETAIWYDARGGLHGGDSWWRKIKEELRACNVFVVVLSPDAMSSDWVNDEINIAWRHKNSPAKMRIFPVLYRRCEVPDDLGTLQIVSFLPPKT